MLVTKYENVPADAPKLPQLLSCGSAILPSSHMKQFLSDSMSLLKSTQYFVLKTCHVVHFLFDFAKLRSRLDFCFNFFPIQCCFKVMHNHISF